ncbi:MAG: hypothetical protein ACREMQ_16005 [Longimicrobiales bacterium]
MDEVHACVDCGKASCDTHGAACHEDKRWHCRDHLALLGDVPGEAGCARHRSECHVDGRVFSLKGTTPCEVCARTTCRMHRARCGWFGAEVCTKDVRDGRCVTCGQLVAAVDPPDEVVTAAARITGDRKAKQWWIARDGGRFVVQLDLGWTRRIVFTVPHGSATAARVIRHTMFGSSSL